MACIKKRDERTGEQTNGQPESNMPCQLLRSCGHKQYLRIQVLECSESIFQYFLRGGLQKRFRYFQKLKGLAEIEVVQSW